MQEQAPVNASPESWQIVPFRFFVDLQLEKTSHYRSYASIFVHTETPLWARIAGNHGQ